MFVRLSAKQFEWCKRSTKCVSTIDGSVWMVSLNVKIRILSEQTSWARYVPDNKCSIERINISTSTQWRQAASARISSIKQWFGWANTARKFNKEAMRAVHVWKRRQSTARVCVTHSKFIRFSSREGISQRTVANWNISHSQRGKQMPMAKVNQDKTLTYSICCYNIHFSPNKFRTFFSSFALDSNIDTVAFNGDSSCTMPMKSFTVHPIPCLFLNRTKSAAELEKQFHRLTFVVGRSHLTALNACRFNAFGKQFIDG